MSAPVSVSMQREPHTGTLPTECCLSCCLVLQDDNVKRKAAKQAAEQQAKRQKDSKGKPRPAGRDKQWWEPEGGPAEPDDDRAFYLQEVRALVQNGPMTLLVMTPLWRLTCRGYALGSVRKVEAVNGLGLRANMGSPTI